MWGDAGTCIHDIVVGIAMAISSLLRAITIFKWHKLTKLGLLNAQHIIINVQCICMYVHCVILFASHDIFVQSFAFYVHFCPHTSFESTRFSLAYINMF